jgi:hypothetical protein
LVARSVGAGDRAAADEPADLVLAATPVLDLRYRFEMLPGVQYADYAADEFAADTHELWVTLQFTLGPEPCRRQIESMRGS